MQTINPNLTTTQHRTTLNYQKIKMKMMQRNGKQRSKISRSDQESQDSRIRWVDEEDLDFDVEIGSISSEEDAKACSSVHDCPYIHGRRSTKHQEIWSWSEISAGLRALPGGEAMAAMLEAGDSERVAKHKHATTTGILLAAWFDKVQLLEKLLFVPFASANITDSLGRTPLHLACCICSAPCCKLLLHHGAAPSCWDSLRRATPLHCAASVASLACLRHLLQAGADVNAGLTGHSALHYAVRSDAVDCVRELLACGACPNTPQVFTETPLHVAAALGSAACVKLLLDHGAEVRVQFGQGKVTPLHLAAEDGNAECARLLLDAAADIAAVNSRKQTPLHLAALSQSTETLELLLRRGADPNGEDCDGRTPLHGAIVKVSRSCECVKLLLDSGARVNKADSFGYTPLHIAALNEFGACVYLLLTHGGDVTAKTKGGASALSFIVRRTPDIMPRFVANLDAAVKLHDHEIGDVDCELKLDFRILVPSVERGESELLLALIDVGQRRILKHPLCETFLFLKWRRIRKFFIFSLAFHVVFVLLFSTYVVGMFLKVCPGDANRNGTVNNRPPSNATHFRGTSTPRDPISLPTNVAGILLLVLNTTLLVKEIFQLCHSWHSYYHSWENWLQWSIIVSTFCCAYHPHGVVTESCDVPEWQHHVAAVGIFLAWLELMMLVGRFPTFGLYIQMFTTVAVNFAKFLLAYSCLLVAFGLSFAVLFPNYSAFTNTNILLVLMKTVIMMSGELEFEDIFYGENTILYPGTAHLIFLAFVILVVVILTNLLVGLAVSDIQGLQQSAGLDRIVRQAELVARLESILFSRLLHCLPKKLLKMCQHSALLLTSSYHWALYIRPNDPRENRVPRYLVNNAFRLVAERKDKPKNRWKYGSARATTEVRTNSFHSGPKVDRYCNSNGFIQTETHQKMTHIFTQVSALLLEFQDHELVVQQKLQTLTNQMCLLQDELKQLDNNADK